ncbi:MAG TPA: hypothetical protein VFJ77_05285 [Gaiellaceae bacterium]|nr:hypothetical protein [Gaiellaceae bacterium]
MAATRSVSHASARERAVHFYTHSIRKLRTETWYWQRVMGVPRTRGFSRALAASSIPRLRHVAAVWRRREKRAFHRAQHPPHHRQLLCIHRYEGSWRDGGAPYWGGLQMSASFQARYGWWLYRTKGTADHWTPLEQIWTAERALRTRGWYPWPNTARYCGLL